MSSVPLGRSGDEPRRRGSYATRLPRLVLVPSSRRRSRLPFALVVLLLLGSGLIGLLLVNTVLAQDAFVLYQLQQRSAALTDQEQRLREAVAQAEAPTALASRAAELGMVPGGDPLFLRLPDGAVLGSTETAAGASTRLPARASIAPTPVAASPTATSPTAASPTAASRRNATAAPKPTTQATTQPTSQPTTKPTTTPAGRRGIDPSPATAPPSAARPRTTPLPQPTGSAR